MTRTDFTRSADALSEVRFRAEAGEDDDAIVQAMLRNPHIKSLRTGTRLRAIKRCIDKVRADPSLKMHVKTVEDLLASILADIPKMAAVGKDLQQITDEIQRSEYVRKVTAGQPYQAITIAVEKVWDTYIGRSKPEGKKVEDTGPLKLVGYDPDNKKPRPWDMRPLLLRGENAVLAGQGGAAKSTVALGIGVANATGLEYLGWKPRGHRRVLIINREDGIDEMNIRLDALMNEMKLDAKARAFALENMKTIGPGSTALVTMDARGQDTRPAFFGKLVQLIKDKKFGLLIADPMIDMHAGPENDSNHMQAVHRAFDEITSECKISGLTVQHFRKNGSGSDQDSIRGSTATVYGARNVFTLEPMTKPEAAMHGVPDDERWKYIRFEIVKSNRGPTGAYRYFEKKTVGDNSDDNDVSAAVLVPKVFTVSVFTVDLWLGRNAWLDNVKAAFERGEPYSRSGERRIDTSLEAAAHITHKKAAEAIKALLAEGVLVVKEYPRAGHHTGKGVTVGKMPDPLPKESDDAPLM